MTKRLRKTFWKSIVFIIFKLIRVDLICTWTNQKQNKPEFVKDIKSYKQCEIALHGLYHEYRNGRFDDFHTITKATAEEEIRAGLEIFQEIGIKPRVFIPPDWKLNDGSIEVLRKLGFRLAETQEKIVLLSHNAIKKIKVPKVLNWDSSGYPERNIVNVTKDEKSFNRLIKQKPSIMRIALHPRDPYGALEEQKQMICQLKDLGYMMSIYTELVHKLQATSFQLSQWILTNKPMNAIEFTAAYLKKISLIKSGNSHYHLSTDAVNVNESV